MNRRIVQLPKQGIAWTCMACCLVMAPASWGSLETELAPAPPSRQSGDWMARQRARFYSTPLLEKGLRAAFRGEDARAVELLNQALKSDPHNNKIRVPLAKAERRLGNWEDALQHSQEILDDHPTYLGGYALYGAIAAEAEQYLAAQHAYEQLLQRLSRVDPLRPEVYRELVNVCRRSGNDANAKRYALEWVRLNDTAEAHLQLAEVAVKQEHWTEAESHLASAASEEASMEEAGRALLRRGYLLSRDRQPAEARKLFLQAREKLPSLDDQREIEQQLGQLAYRESDHATAANHFKRGLLLGHDPDTALSFIHALRQSLQWELGLAEVRKVLREEELPDEHRQQMHILQAQMAGGLGRYREEVTAWLDLYSISGSQTHLLLAAQRASNASLTTNIPPTLLTYLEREADDPAVSSYYQLLKSDNSGPERVATAPVR